jgi:PIN domain nuclease of toxin-antitoxin system
VAVGLLFDTRSLIRALDAPERLPQRVGALIRDAETTIYVSAVSTTEIALKVVLGCLRIPLPRVLRDTGFRELSVKISHTLGKADLPLLHRDPFDRLLVAQARAERLTLITRDRMVSSYPVDRLWE